MNDSKLNQEHNYHFTLIARVHVYPWLSIEQQNNKLKMHEKRFEEISRLAAKIKGVEEALAKISGV